MKFGRYRIYVKGHRSQVQVIALLINIIGFLFLMERVYYVVDLCKQLWNYKMCMVRIARQNALEGSCSDVIACDVELH